MDIVLFAQPYDITARGFYFSSVEKFEAKSRDLINGYGQLVEEFEIQFIDGDELDSALSSAIGLDQCNFANFLELASSYDEWEKIRAIIAFDECGFSFTGSEDIELDDIDIYDVQSLRELAEQFVDEGLMGEIPNNLLVYFDFDALARDLSCEYSETTIAGRHFVYRCY